MIGPQAYENLLYYPSTTWSSSDMEIKYMGVLYTYSGDGAWELFELIRNGMYDAFCVEILSSEPTNKSAKELTEKQSYINQLSKVNQEGSETND